MKKKLRQAYIRGMIDLTMSVFVIGSIAYYTFYVLENYFM